MTPPVLSILFHFIFLLNNFWIVLIPCLSIYFPQSKDIKDIYTCVFYCKVNVCSHGFLISLKDMLMCLHSQWNRLQC